MRTSMRSNYFMLAAASLLIGAPGQATEAHREAVAKPNADKILVPFTDHYEIEIAKPASVVWTHLKLLYVDGERARQQGYTVTPLTDDASAYLGGTIARKSSDPQRPFVKVRVSAMDEKAMLLTLVIDLENPTPVYVSHQVRQTGANTSVYQTIIHTMWPLASKPGETLNASDVGNQMHAIVAGHQGEIVKILTREKAVIEALK
jgi:hypothetical protein